jgi:hypothetical protein
VPSFSYTTSSVHRVPSSLRRPGATIRPRSESPWRLGGSILIACSSLSHGALPGSVQDTSGQAIPGSTQPAAYRDLSPPLPGHCAVHRPQSDLSCHASDGFRIGEAISVTSQAVQGAHAVRGSGLAVSNLRHVVDQLGQQKYTPAKTFATAARRLLPA